MFKPQASLKLLKIQASSKVSKFHGSHATFWGNTYFLCPSLKLPSTVVLQAVSCDADHFKSSAFGREMQTLKVHWWRHTGFQQARLQTIWRSTTKTSKILKTTLAQRQKCGETGMSAEAQAQPGQQERTRKKKSNKICVCAMIRDLWTWKDVIWDTVDSNASRKVSDSFTLKKIGPCLKEANLEATFFQLQAANQSFSTSNHPTGWASAMSS